MEAAGFGRFSALLGGNSNNRRGDFVDIIHFESGRGRGRRYTY